MNDSFKEFFKAGHVRPWERLKYDPIILVNDFPYNICNAFASPFLNNQLLCLFSLVSKKRSWKSFVKTRKKKKKHFFLANPSVNPSKVPKKTDQDLLYCWENTELFWHIQVCK